MSTLDHLFLRCSHIHVLTEGCIVLFCLVADFYLEVEDGPIEKLLTLFPWPGMFAVDVPERKSLSSEGSDSHFFVNSSPISSMHCSRAVCCFFLRFESANSSMSFLFLSSFLITAALF